MLALAPTHTHTQTVMCWELPTGNIHMYVYILTCATLSPSPPFSSSSLASQKMLGTHWTYTQCDYDFVDRIDIVIDTLPTSCCLCICCVNFDALLWLLTSSFVELLLVCFWYFVSFFSRILFLLVGYQACLCVCVCVCVCVCICICIGNYAL